MAQISDEIIAIKARFGVLSAQVITEFRSMDVFIRETVDSEKNVKDGALDTATSKGEQESQAGDGEESQGKGGSGESCATEFKRKREQ